MIKNKHPTGILILKHNCIKIYEYYYQKYLLEKIIKIGH